MSGVNSEEELIISPRAAPPMRRQIMLDLGSATEDEEDEEAVANATKAAADKGQMGQDPIQSSSSSDSSDQEYCTQPPPTKRSKGVVDTGSLVLTCEQYYVTNGNCKKILLAMCIGLDKENPNYCIVDEDEDYKNAKNSRSFKPTNKDLSEEVARRFKSTHGEVKRSKSWSGSRLKQWLLDYPITNPSDVLFLKQEESTFREMLKLATEERNAIDELHSPDGIGPAWIGIFPWLRLYHVVIEDDIKPSYLHVHDWDARDVTDARNSNIRPRTFFELAANKFNDPSFAPWTFSFPDLHQDFLNSVQLRRTENTPLATPDKIKDKLANARAQALRVVNDWEKSGNGSGQRAENSSELGHIVEGQRWRNCNPNSTEEFIDGDNRKNFLRGAPSHVLYLWQLFDINDILSRTLSILPASISVTSHHQGAISSSLSDDTSNPALNRRRVEAEDQRIRSAIAGAFSGLANSHRDMSRTLVMRQLRSARSYTTTLLERLENVTNSTSTTSQRTIRSIEQELEGNRTEIAQLEAALVVPSVEEVVAPGPLEDN